ncbi:MAG: L,D-transpeptidase [Tissierellales bacterium]
MKKYLLTILALVLVFTSCDIGELNKNQKPKNQIQNKIDINTEDGGIGGDKIADDDLEPNINYIDIDKDTEITNIYLNRVGEKKDMTLQFNSMAGSLNRFNSDRLTNSLNAIGAQMFMTQLPDSIYVDIRYHNYEMPYDYLLITSDNVNIYENPTLDSPVFGKGTQYSKVKLEGIAKIEGDQVWYLLSWLENGDPVYGYVTGDAGEPRRFRFDIMAEEVRRLEQALTQNQYGYISNYKNVNGSPPIKDGKAIDEFGIQAYQSAPAYNNLENLNEFRYFPDGMITFIVDEASEYFKVRNLVYDGDFWIPKNYISFDDNLDVLNKVIVVDKANQNQALFENTNEIWTMISYTLATTGVPDNNKYETPTGSFKVLQKRDRFFYLDYGTGEIAGYAPYGTRFSAGAYIHGVPVKYVEVDGEKVDPGMKEYLLTIGTTPRSAKCVRNYTSHAKFIYDWADLNDTAVIVID